MTIIIVTHSMQQAARISDYTAFFLQEVAGEPATLIEYGQTDAIFTSQVDSRTEEYITGRFGCSVRLVPNRSDLVRCVFTARAA